VWRAGSTFIAQKRIQPHNTHIIHTHTHTHTHTDNLLSSFLWRRAGSTCSHASTPQMCVYVCARACVRAYATCVTRVASWEYLLSRKYSTDPASRRIVNPAPVGGNRCDIFLCTTYCYHCSSQHGLIINIIMINNNNNNLCTTYCYQLGFRV
jgi:hypothetical protein